MQILGIYDWLSAYENKTALITTNLKITAHELNLKVLFIKLPILYGFGISISSPFIETIMHTTCER